ncbi:MULTISPECIES: excalibur calcium-binding domain-containing protein [unclassified Psychrobacillus]|uniref:excalibur calcium-binding domain-containing protein n=1 Tax=unclassified Psychrobacillus TaxID=2636677 RepID=UPI00146B8B7A|nr:MULTISPECIES: excalibur calcium-binding domain-containing protein [unclassified Psychrobacillus]NME06551.1 excalibur calcium-binding domain-containing protein [Psychrobacillus sp. BL-248-WT-3]
MKKKSEKLLIAMILMFSFVFVNGTSMEAASIVMWGKTELKLGQIGKATIVKDSTLVKIGEDGSLQTIRKLNQGDEYRVYSYKSTHNGLYGVGGGSYIQKNNNVLYETPSKSKLALLENPPKTSVPTKPAKSENGNGIEVVPGAPTKFQNCKELNKVYPQGVKKGHPAYASKHDRDKDNWACER